MHVVRSLEVGGLEDVVVNLINGSVRLGVESCVAHLIERGPLTARLWSAGTWEGHAESHSWLTALLSLIAMIRRNCVTLIHSHNPQPHLAAVVASLVTGVPIVHTKHGRNSPESPRRVWLYHQLSRRTARVVAVSDDVAHIVRDIERVPESKIRVILNGVDTETFVPPSEEERAESRGRLGLSTNAFVIGSVGRLSPEKNYVLMIRAFARLCRTLSKDHAPVLLIVGDGPDRRRVHDCVADCGVEDRCVLAGMQSDVLSYLHAMDIFSLSSLTEGTSITLLEAGATELPAVVTDVGGNGEVIRHDQTGLVVPSADEAALASAWERLARDTARRHTMGKAARSRVLAEYSLTAMIRKYYREYCAVTGRSQEES